MVSVSQGNRHRGLSTSVKPTGGDDVYEGSEFEEMDTEDVYRFNKYGRWELVPPVSLKTKRIQSLFIPFGSQTGLIFGQGGWRTISTTLQSSGCMIYRARTSATEFNTYAGSDPDSRSYMIVVDFARASMLPKIQMVFSWSDTGANSVSFIGIHNEIHSMCRDVTNPFPNTNDCIGIGYRTSDTNIQVIHNDLIGATNYVNTGIPRSTNVFKIEIEYETTTSVRVSLFNINMELIYENTFTTEIPTDGHTLIFAARIQNANIAARYAIHMFDYIRLEKTKPPLSATID